MISGWYIIALMGVIKRLTPWWPFPILFVCPFILRHQEIYPVSFLVTSDPCCHNQYYNIFHYKDYKGGNGLLLCG